MTNKIEGVVFDLDGVITDTAKLHLSSWEFIVNECFGIELPLWISQATKGINREDSLKLILEEINMTVDDDKFSRLLNMKNEIYIQKLSEISQDDIMPGINNFLEELKLNDIKIALASASTNASIILDKLGIQDYFDIVVDPTNIKSGKPAPDIFLEAAKSLNLSVKNCIGIEDSLAGICAIHTAGMFSVAIGNIDFIFADLTLDSTDKLNLSELNYYFNGGKQSENF